MGFVTSKYASQALCDGAPFPLSRQDCDLAICPLNSKWRNIFSNRSENFRRILLGNRRVKLPSVPVKYICRPDALLSAVASASNDRPILMAVVTAVAPLFLRQVSRSPLAVAD